MEQKFIFTIDGELEGLRLDFGICRIMEPKISRSFLQKIIKNKQVLVNGIPKKSSYILTFGDIVAFNLPEPTEYYVEPENIPLDILYEDDQVIVVNKPKGMVVHPAAGHFEGTMVNALLYHCRDLSGINGVLRPGIVHRIDKDTTGSIIACKNDMSHLSIAAQLKEHSINRTYRAICIGNLAGEELTIDKPIGRHPVERKKMAVVPDGKTAITHVKIIERLQGYTYIECTLETGRTHQIRVHMASIGHPLLGDNIYGPEKCKYNTNGQCLHAYKLGFIHPVTGEYIECLAPIPEYMEKLVKILS